MSTEIFSSLEAAGQVQLRDALKAALSIACRQHIAQRRWQNRLHNSGKGLPTSAAQKRVARDLSACLEKFLAEVSQSDIARLPVSGGVSMTALLESLAMSLSTSGELTALLRRREAQPVLTHIRWCVPLGLSVASVLDALGGRRTIRSLLERFIEAIDTFEPELPRKVLGKGRPPADGDELFIAAALIYTKDGGKVTLSSPSADGSRRTRNGPFMRLLKVLNDLLPIDAKVSLAELEKRARRRKFPEDLQKQWLTASGKI